MNYIVNVKKKEVEEFLSEIRNTKKEDFILLNRFRDKEKAPYVLLWKLDLDKNDLLDEIKKLTAYDFLRCHIDTKKIYIHV